VSKSFEKVSDEAISSLFPSTLSLFRLKRVYEAAEILSYIFCLTSSNSSKQLSEEEYKLTCNILPATIELWVYRDTLSVNINFVRSNIKGFGTLIILSSLYLIREDCSQDGNKLKFVTLEDATERCFKKDNIYLKLGFEYIEPKSPEMKGDLKKILLNFPPPLLREVK
jgi:hypothetical protein